MQSMLGLSLHQPIVAFEPLFLLLVGCSRIKVLSLKASEVSWSHPSLCRRGPQSQEDEGTWPVAQVGLFHQTTPLFLYCLRISYGSPRSTSRLFVTVFI